MMIHGSLIIVFPIDSFVYIYIKGNKMSQISTVLKPLSKRDDSDRDRISFQILFSNALWENESCNFSLPSWLFIICWCFCDDGAYCCTPYITALKIPKFFYQFTINVHAKLCAQIILVITN